MKYKLCVILTKLMPRYLKAVVLSESITYQPTKELDELYKKFTEKE